MLQVFRNAFALPDLRKRLLFTIGILVLYQLAAHVPVPGVNQAALESLLAGQGGVSALANVLNLLSGGALVELLGVGDGRVSVHHRPDYYPVAGGCDSVAGTNAARGRHGGSQEVGDLHVHSRHPDGAVVGHWPDPHLQQRWPGRSFQGFGTDFLPTVAVFATMTAGTFFAIWLGQLITEEGIGQGISIIIFGGIVARIPQNVAQLLADPTQSASGFELRSSSSSS